MKMRFDKAVVKYKSGVEKILTLEDICNIEETNPSEFWYVRYNLFCPECKQAKLVYSYRVVKGEKRPYLKVNVVSQHKGADLLIAKADIADKYICPYAFDVDWSDYIVQ